MSTSPFSSTSFTSRPFLRKMPCCWATICALSTKLFGVMPKRIGVSCAETLSGARSTLVAKTTAHLLIFMVFPLLELNALGFLPRRHPALEHLHQLGERHAEEREHDDRHEHAIGLEVVRVLDDHAAEA